METKINPGEKISVSFSKLMEEHGWTTAKNPIEIECNKIEISKNNEIYVFEMPRVEFNSKNNSGAYVNFPLRLERDEIPEIGKSFKYDWIYRTK
jgi:hypothetical protein